MGQKKGKTNLKTFNIVEHLLLSNKENKMRAHVLVYPSVFVTQLA
jgi:hypothetical protein